MTYLLLQTFLLLLASYFFGAFLACLVKRTMRSERVAVATIGASLPRVDERPAAIAAPAPRAPPTQFKPRSYEPIQPKIDILPRPEPKQAPAPIDTSRFDRTLANAVLPDTTPRRMIVEIRPQVLKPVTARGQAAALKPAPKPAPMPPTAAPAKLEPKVTQAAPPADQSATPMSAAAAAVAAAKAAAAASTKSIAGAPSQTPAPVATPPPTPAAPTPAPTPAPPLKQTAVPVTAPRPAEPPRVATPAPKPTQVAGDDFLRIRAIDENIRGKLHGLGVTRFEQMAGWTAADINRINQALGFSARIESEQWIEQAQILAKGGETYYSRNRAALQPAAPPQAAPPPAARISQQSPPPSSSGPAAPTPSPQQATSGNATAAAAAAGGRSASVGGATPQPAPAQATPPAPPPVQTNQPAAAAKSQPPAQQPPTATPPAPPASPALQVPPSAPPQGTSARPPQRSVSEMAQAAAAAIAAASASVTRGVRPIEPISPLSKVDPKISRPARLSDAIREQESKIEDAPEFEPLGDKVTDGDDLKRIRGIGVLIEKRLNALGIATYERIANWTAADIERISTSLDFKGRIERENWVEQARILGSGGQTEFSRRVDKGEVD